MTRYRRYVCPRDGELMRCPICGVRTQHQREELVREGARIPGCDTHQLALEAAP